MWLKYRLKMYQFIFVSIIQIVIGKNEAWTQNIILIHFKSEILANKLFDKKECVNFLLA
jgi:hypothetical protein